MEEKQARQKENEVREKGREAARKWKKEGRERRGDRWKMNEVREKKD